MINHQELAVALDIARAAVAEGCRITRRVQGRLDAIRQHSKDDRSPVTVADYAVQALIAMRLADAYAGLKLVGEEDAGALRNGANAGLLGAVTDAAREVWSDATPARVADAIDCGNHDASAARYWTLDPIDGTKGFLRGGQYAISLALIENGAVVLGVLGCPNLSRDFQRPFTDPDPVGTLFYASRDSECWSADADGSAEPQALRLADNGDVTTMRVCESVEAAHSRIDETTHIVRHLGARGTPARLDSQCKYAVVARGQADAYLRLPTRPDYVERIWDHAAGKIIAERAGAVVSDIRGQALDFGHGIGLSANRGVICAAPGFHQPLVGAIETLALFPD